MSQNLQNLALINLALAFVLPQLVALVTHRLASGLVKTAVLLVLSFAAALGSQIVVLGGVVGDWKTLLLSVAATFGGSGLMHTIALKPIGLTGTDGTVSAIGSGTNNALIAMLTSLGVPKGLTDYLEQAPFVAATPVDPSVSAVAAPADVAVDVPADAPADPVVDAPVDAAPVVPDAPAAGQ